ncbi:MAG TPA: YaiI/YqxD family protein [Thermoanaerobaculia bacterium]|nr:YaiI/YqxD family protein [Thermoanaerobaculia bacterium]
MRIFVDADACPVKQEIYRVADRLELEVTVVANSFLNVPADPLVTLAVVAEGIDAADDWIVDHVRENDIVITGDIPLAARSLRNGALVLGFGGKAFTHENIGDALATRGLLSDLRDRGEVSGGPAPFDKRDRSRFLQSLDSLIQQIRRDR